MSYAIIWRFEVPEANSSKFEAAYGCKGPWADLFAKAPGFQGIELLRDEAQSGSYLTMDRWLSRGAFDAFMDEFGASYVALDLALEGMASEEIRIGGFEMIDR